jgi:FSR family fosmidomycin resistance protein-like MFS transporter
LTVATLRVVPVMGVPYGLAFLLKQRNVPESEIGITQSIFLLSGSLGTLMSPLISRPGRELAALVGTIAPAALGLSLLTQTEPGLFYLGLSGSGFCLQAAMPLLMSYAQRLLPRGRRVAASLTLGTSWGLGGIIVSGLQAHFVSIGRLDWMLWALVPFALAAGLGSLLLPRLDQIPGKIAAVG